MFLTAGHAACSSFKFDVTDENKDRALANLQKTGLEPVTMVNGDPLIAVAVSTDNINKEPWRLRLPTALATNSVVENEEHIESISSESCGPSIPPSRTAILQLSEQIMPKQPIFGTTYTMSLSKQEVYEIVQQYMQKDTLKLEASAEWMNKDGLGAMRNANTRKNTRKHGCHYNVVKPKYRDSTYADIGHINSSVPWSERHIRMSIRLDTQEKVQRRKRCPQRKKQSVFRYTSSQNSYAKMFSHR